MATKETEKEMTKYKGSDLIFSAKYKRFRDILSASLDLDGMYTIEEVEKIIDRFNKAKA